LASDTISENTTEQLTADTTADNPGDRIPERSETEFFEDSTAEISTNGTA